MLELAISLMSGYRIGEKFQQWTDQTPSMEEMLDGATLYWFTESFPRAIYGYRQFFGPQPQFFHNDPQYYCKKPLGYSWHPYELAPIPVPLVAKVRARFCFAQERLSSVFADSCNRLVI